MGEKSVRSGRDGEKIADEILKLIGWKSTSKNFDITCSLPSKHKSENKSKKGTHGLDFVYSYDNPLVHNNRDIVIGSVKHDEKYPNSLKSIFIKHIEDLSISLECARIGHDEINNIIGTSNYKDHYKGLLFWLSSNPNEKMNNVTELVDQNSFSFSSNFE